MLVLHRIIITLVEDYRRIQCVPGGHSSAGVIHSGTWPHCPCYPVGWSLKKCSDAKVPSVEKWKFDCRKPRRGSELGLHFIIRNDLRLHI